MGKGHYLYKWYLHLMDRRCGVGRWHFSLLPPERKRNSEFAWILLPLISAILCSHIPKLRFYKLLPLFAWFESRIISAVGRMQRITLGWGHWNTAETPKFHILGLFKKCQTVLVLSSEGCVGNTFWWPTWARQVLWQQQDIDENSADILWVISNIYPKKEF